MVAPYRPLEQIVRIPTIGDFMRQIYVSSVYGSDDHDGVSPDRPLATLDAAINRHAYNLTTSTTEHGMTVHLMPGHAETVATASAITLDIPNLRVIGHGWGTTRPTFTFSATASSIVISGANVYIENCVFKTGVDLLVTMLTITGTNCTLQSCTVLDNNASYHVINPITSSDTADDLSIFDHIHDGHLGKAGPASCIKIVGGENVLIIPKWMYADVTSGLIYNVTTASLNLQIMGRWTHPAFLRTSATEDLAINLKADTTGQVSGPINIRLQDDAANIDECLVGAAMSWFMPIYIVNANNEQGIAMKFAATADA